MTNEDFQKLVFEQLSKLNNEMTALNNGMTGVNKNIAAVKGQQQETSDYIKGLSQPTEE